MPELRVERLTRYDQFLDLKQEWNSLAELTVRTVFLTHDWLSAWWRVYGDALQLWILTVRDGDGLIGVLPLALRRDSFGVRHLMFVGSGDVTPNHLDVIAQEERYLEISQALCSYLLEVDSEWDFLDLDKLPADAPIVTTFKQKFSGNLFATNRKVVARCPYAELPETFGLYLQSRGYSTRAGYRRVKRYLERDFPGTRFGKVESLDEFDRVFDALITLHQKRWTKRGYPGAFSNDGLISFHRAMALRALDAGTLRMYYLQVAGDVVAIYYCFRVANSIQYYIGGFDDRLAKYSPGMLITGYSIEQAILEGANYFDFLEGDESYKSHWASGMRENVRFAVFNKHWRGRVAYALYMFLDAVKEIGLKFVPAGVRRPLWLALQRWRARNT